MSRHVSEYFNRVQPIEYREPRISAGEAVGYLALIVVGFATGMLVAAGMAGVL